MNEPSRPSAQGSLAKTPFAHLVLYLYQRRSSGTLIVKLRGRASAETKVLFHRGRAVAANLAQPAAALDQGLLPLCAALDGDFEFHESDLVGSGPTIVTGMFDPLAFVAEATRRQVRPDIVEEVVSKFAGATLALLPAMDLTRLSLTPEESRFAEPLIHGPVTFEALCAQSELDPDLTRKLLYVLFITKVAGQHDPAAAENYQRSTPADSGAAPAHDASANGQAGRGPRPASDRSRNSGAAWRAIAARAAEMATNRPPPTSGTTPARSPVPAAAVTPGSEPAPARPSRPQATSPASPQPSAAEPRVPRRSATLPLNLQQAPRPATPAPGPRTDSRPVTPETRAVSRPITPPPTASTSSAAPRAVSRPITPAPGQRPPSRPLTPANLPQERAKSRPISRPLSRPLTPANFTPLPSGSQPRTTPTAPISRVTPRPSQPDLETLDANGKFKRVEQLCQRHAYDEALPIARGLVEEDRKNAKYLGMLAHVLLGRSTDGTIGKDIVETVNLALRIDTDEIRALYVKARCYKRMGKEREALHYFKRTVAVDPNHLDATREIRLLMLRMSEKRKR